MIMEKACIIKCVLLNPDSHLPNYSTLLSHSQRTVAVKLVSLKITFPFHKFLFYCFVSFFFFWSFYFYFFLHEKLSDLSGKGLLTLDFHHSGMTSSRKFQNKPPEQLRYFKQ